MTERPDNAENGEILDSCHSFSQSEVARLCDVTITELYELVEEQIVVPVNPGAAELEFPPDCIVRVKRICRIREDLALDAHAAAIVLDLLDEVYRLRTRNSRH